MKNKTYILLVSFVIVLLLGGMSHVKAQDPPHPPTQGHGNNGNQQPGGSAPLDGGLTILLALGLSYGARKTLKSMNKEE